MDFHGWNRSTNTKDSSLKVVYVYWQCFFIWVHGSDKLVSYKTDFGKHLVDIKSWVQTRGSKVIWFKMK